MQDSNGSNGGGRKGPIPVPANITIDRRGGSPPPVPATLQRRFPTADFRGAKVDRASRPPGPPQGVERRIPGDFMPAPPGAKTTQSIAKPLSAIFGAGLGVQNSDDTYPGVGHNVPKNTMAPASLQQEDAAERAAKMETRFLRFGAALYRVSEISGENWTNWIAEPALLREKVGKAVEALKGKRAEGEGYAADYQMLKAFSKEISEGARLNDYLIWMRGNEKKFSMMANVYAELSMSPLTPYVEVMDACAAKAGKESDGGLRVFSMMVEDIREYEGTDYNYGELYKRMFDAWYVRKSAEAMVKVYENAGIAQQRDSALTRVGELIEEVGSLMAENRRLEEAAKLKSVSPEVMGQVHAQRGNMLLLDAENETLKTEIRRDKNTITYLGEKLEEKSADVANLTKQLVDEKKAVGRMADVLSQKEAENKALGEEDAKSRSMSTKLSEKLDEKSAEVAKLRGEKSSLSEALADERKAGQKLIENIRLLMDRVEAYDKRTAEMEGRLSVMEKHVERLQGEKADLARELRLIKEPELAQRETMVSGEFLVPEEVAREAPAAVPVLAVPWATPKEDSALLDLRRIAAASMEPPAPAKAADAILTGMEKEISSAISEALSKPSKAPAALIGQTDVDEEVSAALDAGFAAVTASEGEGKIVAGESGSGRKDRSDREAAAQVSLVAEAARMQKVPEPPDETAVVETAKEKPGEITEQIDIEDRSVGYKELRQGRPEAAFWGTRPGKAVKAIFAYGFAGKGTLPERPVAKVVESGQAYDPLTYDQVMQERELEQSRFLKGVREYNAWYNVAGRWIRARRDESISAAHAVSDFYSRERRRVQVVAAGAFAVGAIALATATFLNNAETERAERAKAEQMLSRPAVTQVATPDVDTGVVGGMKAAGAAKAAPAAPPLEKPVLTNVLEKHGLQLDNGTHIVQFYKGLPQGMGVQERYVILEGLLASKENLDRYEKKYVEGPVLDMYADFLNTAMDYAGLEGQTSAEKGGVRELGGTVAKRLDQRAQQKRIKEKVGKDRASELREIAAEFSGFAEGLPVAVEEEERTPIMVPVVTAEQLKEMKKSGETHEAGVIILPDKTEGRPFDMGAEMLKAVGPDFRVLDTPAKVNEFGRKIDKTEGLREKFLMHAHLTGALVEHELGSKMSEKRVLSMHIEAMNVAIRFAMDKGQGMTAVAEALTVFEISNSEVKRLVAYKGMKDEISPKGQENLRWMRERAKELGDKVDAYDRHKGDVVAPLPGSPAVDNLNGAPSAVPERIQIDRNNEYAAIQTLVFSEHGLSIFEHPLKVYGQMKRAKMNNFDRFVVLENLVEKITRNAALMDGLTKAEQFEMLKIMAAYLRSTKMAANEPKNWRNGYKKNDILLSSLAIGVSETITELLKLEKGEVSKREKHLQFQMDQGTYEELARAKREFDEQINYEYNQKARGSPE